MAIFAASEEKLRATLLVLPESSMMSLASSLDPMRAANRISGRILFEWQIATLNNKPARLTCDLMVEPDTRLDFDSGGDVLIVIASFNQQQHAGPAHLKLIKRISRNFEAIGGIEAGSWILARCGLLDSRAATTHWEDLEEFGTHFPGVDLRPDRYVVDEPVFTTGGASPTFDLILHLIRKRYGYPLAMVRRQARLGIDRRPRQRLSLHERPQAAPLERGGRRNVEEVEKRRGQVHEGHRLCHATSWQPGHLDRQRDPDRLLVE